MNKYLKWRLEWKEIFNEFNWNLMIIMNPMWSIICFVIRYSFIEWLWMKYIYAKQWADETWWVILPCVSSSFVATSINHSVNVCMVEYIILAFKNLSINWTLIDSWCELVIIISSSCWLIFNSFHKRQPCKNMQNNVFVKLFQKCANFLVLSMITFVIKFQLRLY